MIRQTASDGCSHDWEWTDIILLTNGPGQASLALALLKDLRAFKQVSHLHGVQGADGKWQTAAVIKQDWTSLNSWVMPKMPPLITDILLSLDDRYRLSPAIYNHDLEHVVLEMAVAPDLQQMLSWLGPSTQPPELWRLYCKAALRHAIPYTLVLCLYTGISTMVVHMAWDMAFMAASAWVHRLNLYSEACLSL